jgi:hypothetical protein
MPLLEPPAKKLVKTRHSSRIFGASYRTWTHDTAQVTPCTALHKVPLRDIGALNERATQYDPPFSIWSIVSSWVAALDATPWLAPSVPFEELSDRPRYEVRYAELPDTNGVAIFYRRYFDGEIVDLMEVTSLD